MLFLELVTALLLILFDWTSDLGVYTEKNILLVHVFIQASITLIFIGVLSFYLITISHNI